MGDSSGGHLALALTRWVKETREERGAERDEEEGWRLEEPAGLVLFSVRALPLSVLERLDLLSN